MHLKISRKRSYTCGQLGKNITKLITEPCPITTELHPSSPPIPISFSERSLQLLSVPSGLGPVFVFLIEGLEFLSSALRYDSGHHCVSFLLFHLDCPWKYLNVCLLSLDVVLPSACREDACCIPVDTFISAVPHISTVMSTRSYSIEHIQAGDACTNTLT